MSEQIYSLDEIKNILNTHKQYLSDRYSVESFLLFGSYAKNQPTPDSDIDLLVNLSSPIDMFDFIELQDYLSLIFKKKIDLGTPNGLKGFVKNIILKEAIVL
jgi:predicted nucleotidyltransferase